MLVWSVFCGLTAVASNFTQLMIFRIVFGIGESPMSPVTTKMTRNWFPRDELGMVMGITPPAGNMLGAAVAGPLVGFVAVGYGWTLLWTIFARDRPDQSPFVSQAELAQIGRGSALAPRPTDEEALPLRHYIRSPAVLATAAEFFASNYILYFFITWLPSYLTNARHLNIKTMSIITVIPWLLGAIGSVAGGVLADWLLRASGRPVFSRKIMVTCGLAIAAAALLLTTQTTSLTAVVALIAIANITLHATPGSTWVLLQELVPPSRLGVVSGYVSGLANLSGIIGPAITGFIIQYGGGYGSSFVLAGLVAICSAIAVMCFVRDSVGSRQQRPIVTAAAELQRPL
jgi:ACS family hexuronate transporter-like MFS transporter